MQRRIGMNGRMPETGRRGRTGVVRILGWLFVPVVAVSLAACEQQATEEEPVGNGEDETQIELGDDKKAQQDQQQQQQQPGQQQQPDQQQPGGQQQPGEAGGEPGVDLEPGPGEQPQDQGQEAGTP